MTKTERLLSGVIVGACLIMVCLSAALIDMTNTAVKWHTRATEQQSRAFEAEAERDACKLVLDGAGY